MNKKNYFTKEEYDELDNITKQILNSSPFSPVYVEHEGNVLEIINAAAAYTFYKSCNENTITQIKEIYEETNS